MCGHGLECDDDDDDDDDVMMRCVLHDVLIFSNSFRFVGCSCFTSSLPFPFLFLFVMTEFFAHFSFFDPSVCSRSAVRDSFVSSISHFLTIINDDDPAGNKQQQYPSRELAHG